MKMYITYVREDARMCASQCVCIIHWSGVVNASSAYNVRADRNTDAINSVIGKMQTHAAGLHQTPQYYETQVPLSPKLSSYTS